MDTAARELLDHDIGRLIVVDHGKVVGVISRSDILKLFLPADHPNAGCDEDGLLPEERPAVPVPHEGVAMDATPRQGRSLFAPLYGVKRWMYRSGGPGLLARVMNRISALQFSAGILSPRRAVTLEVRGRRSGRPISFPVVVADYDGESYLVSMLGEDANWVRNVRAARGQAVLRRHGSRLVRLEEVEPSLRAPILRRYLALAPGARPHVPVDRTAPLEHFERIAAQFPVFRITQPGAARGVTR